VRLSAVPLLVCLFRCCDHHCKAVECCGCCVSSTAVFAARHA
jgi:hypothetical protein